MTVAGKAISHAIGLCAIWLQLGAAAPVQAQAAAARLRAQAEIVNPAQVDTAALLAAAVSETGAAVAAGAGTAAGSVTRQPRREVRLITSGKVALLSIDFN